MDYDDLGNGPCDEAVKATNDDASTCKRCATQLGYWQDPYISLFVKSGDRKAPEINRGYYARIKAIDILLRKFLEKTKNNCQIVNLGAGFDTLHWRLKDEGIDVLNFVEVDFPSVTSKKCFYIKRTKQLLEKIHREDGEVKFSSTDLHASRYHVVGTDLRNLSQVQSKLVDAEVDFNLPTLFLAECVLVYVEVQHTAALLTWLASRFPTAYFINYEQVNMSDRFAEVMLKNLRSRGCTLAGVSACKDLESQKTRFISTNWEGASVWSMVDIYASLPFADIKRIEAIEFLDEQELLVQLFQHYCICVAWNDKDKIGLSKIEI